MLKPFFTALTLRATIAFLGVYYLELPDSAADAAYNNNVGWLLSQSGFWSIFQDDVGRSGSEYYIRFIGIVYYFFGWEPYLPIFVNAVLGSLTTINVYYTIKLVWGIKWAKKCAWIIALFPSMILYSSLMHREAPIYFFVSLGFLFLIKFLRSKKNLHFVCFLICFILASSLHSIFILVPISLVIHGFLNQLDNKKTRRIFNKKRLLQISLTITAVLIVVFSAGYGVAKFSSLFSSFGSSDNSSNAIQVIANAQRSRSKEVNRATYLPNFTVSSPIDIFFQIPIRITYFILTPFPWMISNISDVFGSFDAFLYLSLLLFAVSGWKKKSNENFQKLILFLFILVLSVLSISTSNYGTAIRHRAKLLPFIVILLPSFAPVVIRKNTSKYLP